MNAKKMRHALAVAKGREKILQEWHAERAACPGENKEQLTARFLARLARCGKIISKGTLYNWNSRREASGGVSGLVDGRQVPRAPQGPKLLTFDLPGVSLNVQISDAVVDIRERRNGYLIQVRQRPQPPKPEANKGAEKGGSNAV